MLQAAEILKRKLSKRAGAPFNDILNETVIEETLAQAKVKYRNRLFTPIVTIWAFLYQVLDPDKSLANTVKQILCWLVVEGAEQPSLNTGGYAKARKRLPESVVQALFEHTGQALCAKVKPEQLWNGRQVKLLDGSSVVMADTEANQNEYPQHQNQKPGCGFPLAKIVVMFSLSTAAAIGVRIAALNTSEITLARSWYETLEPNDVVLADRAYGSYVDLALVQQQGADGVFRKHQSRNSDFRRGKRLGKNDHIVIWKRPSRCPQAMDEAEFKALPATLKVREVRFCVERPGWRTKSVTVVTTLLDPKAYPKAQLAQLYGLRWQAEINLDQIKTTLGMEMLRAQSPQMVRKEIYVHLMAYNLLRDLMWQAASQTQQDPLRLSVQGCRQSLNQFRSRLAEAGRVRLPRFCKYLLEMISQDMVPLRPDRYEPRRRKRRSKAFPLMNKPRATLKQKLAAA
jgi:hypothetical protein